MNKSKKQTASWSCLKCQKFIGKTKKELMVHILKDHENINNTNTMSNAQIKKYETQFKEFMQNENGFPYNKQIHLFSYQKEWKKMEEFKKIEKISEISILTFNILFDLYDKDLIYTEKRIPIILKHFSILNADIIGLQEVTSPFLQELLKDEFIQKNYYISDIKGNTVDPFGQLLLTKIPLKELYFIKFSTYKSFLQGTFEINDEDFSISIIHLTSDKSKDYQKKRYEQIETVIKYTKEIKNQIIFGDFNFGDEETVNDNLLQMFNDCWKLKHYDSPGFTFDPKLNELANTTSVKKKQRRLDRVLFSSKNDILNLNDISIVFDEKFDKKFFMSDHFGLFTKFKLN
eukprot:gene7542-11866_t